MNNFLDSPAAVNELLVAEITDRFIEEVKQGLSPSIDEYAAAHPEIADIIRQVFPALSLLDSFQPPMEPAGDGDRNAMSQLGDFRIVREIGRGGMGVVYEAEQLSLGRRMALKVLPLAATLSVQQLERFKNEARLAASLKHPHIVSVHSVGVERGVHYYAMELVEGCSLAQAIIDVRKSDCGLQNKGTESAVSAIRTPQSEIDAVAALSTVRTVKPQDYFRRVAHLIADAADALDYAHNQGIVHRDIKPGNLLLDHDGKISVTDFGLARLEADAGVTLTGDLLGTLRYMSPEQAAGRSAMVDYRTDIYALGATLFELLTLRPTFVGADRAKLLHHIAEDMPQALRQVDPRIPLDLETITAKALEKEPADRYQSASALAADLKAFVDDRKIAARPPKLAQRIARWSRRHVVCIWTVAASILVLSVLATWLITKHVYEQQAISEAVELSLSQARQAVTANQIGLAQSAVAQAQRQAEEMIDAGSPLRRRISLLNEELIRYEQFATLYQQARSRRSQVYVAKSALEIYDGLQGDSWRTLLRQSNAPQAHVNRVAEQLYEMLVLLAHDKLLWTFKKKSTEAKLTAIGAAQSYLSQAAMLRNPTKGYYWVLAACSQRLGDVTEGEVRAHHDAEALRLRALANETPPQNAAEIFYISRDRRWGCASSQVRPAFRQPFAEGGVLAAYREMLRIEPHYYNALFFSGLQYANEEKNLEAAIAIFNGCLALWPRDSTALGNRAQCLAELGRHDESLIDAAQAVQIARELLIGNENSTTFRSKLCAALLAQGDCLRLAGGVDGARSAWEEAKRIDEALANEDPEYWSELSATLVKALAELDNESLETNPSSFHTDNCTWVRERSKRTIRIYRYQPSEFR